MKLFIPINFFRLHPKHFFYLVTHDLAWTCFFCIVCPVGEFQMQPEPSLVLSQLAQRQQGSLTHTGPLARQPSPPPLSAPSPAQETLEAFPKAPEPSHHRDGSSMAPSQAADSQGSSTQQRQIKTQKRRIPPTSKVNYRFKKHWGGMLSKISWSITCYSFLDRFSDTIWLISSVGFSAKKGV